jgi:hypothetical protein
MRRRRRTAVAALAAGALAVGAQAFVTAADAHNRHGAYSPTSVRTVVDGLDGPRGLAEKYGRLVVSETDGTFSLVYRRHHRDQAQVIRLGRVPTEFPPAVDIGPDGTVWILTGLGEPKRTATTLFKWQRGDDKPVKVANIGRYQAKDTDPYDTEDHPTDSNPFGVAALSDGTVIVADAGGNDLLKVTAHGKISTVARFKTRTIPMPKGFPKTLVGEDGESMPAPPVGTPIPSESVPTSVTVGPDGYWYVGELRGFPGTPGTSQIWRIKPGTSNAVCDPAAPTTGDCTRYADGLTSIMDLGAKKYDDDLYAVEFSKLGWPAVEILKKPGAEVGALIKVSDDGSRLRELAPGSFNLPGGVAVDRYENVYVAGPVFGPGSVQVVKKHHRSHGGDDD